MPAKKEKLNEVNFYIKLTKKCNLRCRYCYEQQSHGDSRILTLSDMALILQKIKAYCLANKLKKVRLSYSGGEPLLLGTKYLAALSRLSDRILGQFGIEVQINVETNLTLMDEEYIRIFKKHQISVVASFDVFGQLRQFKSGVSSDQIIIDKMILMLKHRLPFSATVVVTKRNFKRGAQIYDFFKKIFIDFLTLKVHAWSGSFLPRLLISDQEYIRFLKTIADKYLEEKPNISNINVDSYVRLLQKIKDRYLLCYYAKDCLKGKVFIDNDGEVYPCSNLRYREFRLGNILCDPLEAIFDAPILKRLKQRYSYIKKECRQCKYVTICSGGCMAVAHSEGRIMGKSRSCCSINRAMFKFVWSKLKNRGAA
jgi:uncharacterized protein